MEFSLNGKAVPQQVKFYQNMTQQVNSPVSMTDKGGNGGEIHSRAIPSRIKQSKGAGPSQTRLNRMSQKINQNKFYRQKISVKY